MKMSKRLVILLVVAFIPIVLFNVDKLYGKIKEAKTEKKIIDVEIGDLIFRTNSYILSSDKFYYKSGLPGHLAIAVSEGTFLSSDESLGNIDVVESALLNRNRGEFQADVAINKAFENFSKIRGKRFLLKMHLDKDQKVRLIELSKKQIGKPYSILASKSSQETFNCATFARYINLEISGFDLDSDGGSIVFPNDILKSSRFDKTGDRIRF
jgi:uncharacterized protein YycO